MLTIIKLFLFYPNPQKCSNKKFREIPSSDSKNVCSVSVGVSNGRFPLLFFFFPFLPSKSDWCLYYHLREGKSVFLGFSFLGPSGGNGHNFHFSHNSHKKGRIIKNKFCSLKASIFVIAVHCTIHIGWYIFCVFLCPFFPIMYCTNKWFSDVSGLLASLFYSTVSLS